MFLNKSYGKCNRSRGIGFKRRRHGTNRLVETIFRNGVPIVSATGTRGRRRITWRVPNKEDGAFAGENLCQCATRSDCYSLLCRNLGFGRDCPAWTCISIRDAYAAAEFIAVQYYLAGTPSHVAEEVIDLLGILELMLPKKEHFSPYALANAKELILLPGNWSVDRANLVGRQRLFRGLRKPVVNRLEECLRELESLPKLDASKLSMPTFFRSDGLYHWSEAPVVRPRHQGDFKTFDPYELYVLEGRSIHGKLAFLNESIRRAVLPVLKFHLTVRQTERPKARRIIGRPFAQRSHRAVHAVTLVVHANSTPQTLFIPGWLERMKGAVLDFKPP